MKPDARARARVHARQTIYTMGLSRLARRIRQASYARVSGTGVDGNSDVPQCSKERERERERERREEGKRGRKGGRGGLVMAVIELLIKPVN